MYSVCGLIQLQQYFHETHFDIINHLLQYTTVHINNRILLGIGTCATVVHLTPELSWQLPLHKASLILWWLYLFLFLFSHLIGNFIGCFKERLPTVVNPNFAKVPWWSKCAAFVISSLCVTILFLKCLSSWEVLKFAFENTSEYKMHSGLSVPSVSVIQVNPKQ